MTCHLPCDLTLTAFFLSFAIRYRSISDLKWITYAAISLYIPAVKRNNRSRIVAYVFYSARSPNSFFVDCFSFEANCFWKHQCVFGQLCIQLACVADETKPRYSPSANQRPKACSAPRVLPVLSIIGSNWLLHMAVLSCTVIGRVDVVEL